MSIEEGLKPCWTITCDRCDESMGSDEFGCVHHADRGDAEEVIKDSDWYEAANGKLICDSCIEGGNVHEVACPKCGAEPDENCAGFESWRVHDERIEEVARRLAEPTPEEDVDA